jgi:tRNA(Ile2) C34 agmatinyltransferase TiaS
MNEVELLPCPFCGGEADFLGDTATIKCKECGGAFLCTNPLISRFEVAQAWNERADHD